MSLEEERARQAALAAPALETVPEGSNSVEAVLAQGGAAFQTPVKKEEASESTALLADVGMEDNDEDDDLARALAMSRGDDVEMGDADEDDEDAEIARAIALSMKEDEDETKKET